MALPPNDQHVTYQLQHRKCGKKSCSTCRQGQGHGPYWYAYWREGTRLRSGYVGKINPYILSEPSQENDISLANKIYKEPDSAIPSTHKKTRKARTNKTEAMPMRVKSFAATSAHA